MKHFFLSVNTLFSSFRFDQLFIIDLHYFRLFSDPGFSAAFLSLKPCFASLSAPALQREANYSKLPRYFARPFEK